MSGKNYTHTCKTKKNDDTSPNTLAPPQSVALSVKNATSKVVQYVELLVRSDTESRVFQMPPTASPDEDYLKDGETWKTSKTFKKGLPTEYILKAMAEDLEEWRCNKQNLDPFSELEIELQFE